MSLVGVDLAGPRVFTRELASLAELRLGDHHPSSPPPPQSGLSPAAAESINHVVARSVFVMDLPCNVGSWSLSPSCPGVDTPQF